MKKEDIIGQVELYDDVGFTSDSLSQKAYIISHFIVLVDKKKKQENLPIAEGTPPPRVDGVDEVDSVDVGDVSLDFGV